MADRGTAEVVAYGDPGDRPPGFPCFGCGAQVREERSVEVRWVDHDVTTREAICAACVPKYVIYECAPFVGDVSRDPRGKQSADVGPA